MNDDPEEKSEVGIGQRSGRRRGRGLIVTVTNIEPRKIMEGFVVYAEPLYLTCNQKLQRWILCQWKRQAVRGICFNPIWKI
jgi:hypothetical protein